MKLYKSIVMDKTTVYASSRLTKSLLCKARRQTEEKLDDLRINDCDKPLFLPAVSNWLDNQY